MRLSIVWLLLLMFTTYAKSVGQDQMVTLQLEKVTFYELFEAIRKQTGLHFLYHTGQLSRMSEVCVTVKDRKVSEVLEEVLKDTPFTARFDDNTVMLVKREVSLPQTSKSRLIFGKVVDQKKTPLPGVNVRVKGVPLGTITDVNGFYRLRIPLVPDLYLVFSFLGKQTTEVKYEGRDTINVVLKDKANVMDEVVVTTGYQNINRKDMVGAYKTLNAKEVNMPVYSSIDQMLQGQFAGMIVTNTSSRVGTSPQIQIRGASTLLGNQDPLWVVDGIIQPDPIRLNASALMTQNLSTIIGNQISWLNPQDINTITVLKDASATAIYGSKASNGVIVITTKQGVAGRLTVNYTGNFTFTGRPTYDRFNRMNSQERLQFSEETIEWGGFYSYKPLKQMVTYEGIYRMYLEGDLKETEFLQQKRRLEENNTDWLKLLTQNAFTHKHSLSISGGAEKITYNVSFGYINEQGQETGNDNERYTGHLSLNAKLRKNMRLGVTANVTSSTTKGFGTGVSPLDYALNTSRTIPAYDEHGDPYFYRKRSTYTYNTEVESLGYNIVNERDNSGSKVNNFILSSSLDFKWEFTDWLAYQFTGGYNHTSKENENYATERTFYIAQKYRGYDYGTVSSGEPEFKAACLPFGGILYTNSVIQSAYNVQNKLLVSKTFNENHRLNIMLGMEVRSTRNRSTENTVWGYMPEKGHKIARPVVGNELVPMGTTMTAPNLGVLEELYNDLRPAWGKGDQTDNYLSWFATVAYSIKNRYVLNANIRNDESNRFGQDVKKRVDPTYSMGISWRMTEESFMQHALWLNNLTLRATYGVQGNALSNKSADLILQLKGIEPIYQQNYATIERIPNPHLTWERTKTWNFGLDLELFNFFNITAEYYRRSSNAIVDQDIPYEYGKTTMDLNGGIIYNKGMEFTVAFTPVRREDFALTVSLNSSKNWNEAGKKVIKMKSSSLITPFLNKVAREGYPVGSFWSFAFAGLDPNDGHPLFKYLDVPEEQRDAEIDPTSFMVYSGQSTPSFTGGINLGIRYKTLFLDAGFSLLVGGKKRLPSPYQNFINGCEPDPERNLSKELLNRWKRPGDEKITCIPALVRGGGEYKMTLPDNTTWDWFDLWKYSDAMTVSSSFLRCRQIGLTWNVDPDWCRRMGLKTLSLSGVVNNVFVVANKRFQGMDPELMDSVMPRAYSLGISVGF